MKKRTLLLLLLALVLMVTPVFAASGAVSATLNYRDIVIKINGNVITPTDVNGNGTEPFILNDSTYLPLRAVAEAVGYNVSWDDETNTITLSNTFIACVTSYDAETDIVYVLTEDGLAERVFRVEADAEILAGNVYEFSDDDGDMEYSAVKHMAEGPNEERESGWQQDAVIAYVNYKEDSAAARNVNTYSPADGYLTFFYAVNGSETRSMDASGATILDLTGSGITALSDLDDMMFCTVHVVNDAKENYGGYVDYIVVTNTEHAGDSFHTLSILFSEDSNDVPSAQMKYFYGENGYGDYGLWAKGKISKAGYSIYTGSLQGDDVSSELYKQWQKIEYWKYGVKEDGSVDPSSRTQIATRESYFGLVNDHPEVQIGYSYAIVQSAILTDDFVMDYRSLSFPAVN